MTLVTDRHLVIRRGINLSYLTILYNSLEAIGSLMAGIMARSVTLVGFGADSVIEVTSSVAARWRLRSDVSLALLALLPVLLGCSTEKAKENYDEPTPFELYQAKQRLQTRSRQAVDTIQDPTRPTTGDADRDFLRAISDHDKNVVVLSDAALESNTRPEMEDLIRLIEERHGHNLDAVTAVLRRSFNDRYVSQATNHTRTTAEVLRRPGADHRRVFLSATLAAEENASRFIDSVLPKIKRADVRTIARNLKSAKTAEIGAIRNELTRMGTS